MKGSTPTRASPGQPTAPSLSIVDHVATLTWTDPSSGSSLVAELLDAETGFLERKPVAMAAETVTFAAVTQASRSYLGRVRAVLSNEPGPWSEEAEDTD